MLRASLSAPQSTGRPETRETQGETHETTRDTLPERSLARVS